MKREHSTAYYRRLIRALTNRTAIIALVDGLCSRIENSRPNPKSEEESK